MCVCRSVCVCVGLCNLYIFVPPVYRGLYGAVVSHGIIFAPPLPYILPDVQCCNK